MKFPWQRSDDKDKLLETYRTALSAYADPDNWSQVSCYGTLKLRRWKGGEDGPDLALQALQEAGDIGIQKKLDIGIQK